MRRSRGWEPALKCQLQKMQLIKFTSLMMKHNSWCQVQLSITILVCMQLMLFRPRIAHIIRSKMSKKRRMEPLKILPISKMTSFRQINQLRRMLSWMTMRSIGGNWLPRTTQLLPLNQQSVKLRQHNCRFRAKLRADTRNLSHALYRARRAL